MKQSTRIDEDNCFKPYPDGYLMQEGFSTTFYHIASDFSIEELTYFPTTVFSTNKRRTNIFANTVPATRHTTKEYIGVVPVGKITSLSDSTKPVL